MTESAVREALINSVSADNGLTEGPTQGNIQLGGDLIQNTTITQDNAEELNIVNAGTANTTVQLTSTGDFVVDGQTGDVTIDQDGAVTAGNGVAVTGGNLDVTNALDVNGATTLDQTNIVTDDGDLNVSGTSSISMTSSEDVADAITLTTDGGTTAGIGISNTTGTGASSIQVSSTSGGVDIDGASGITFDASGGAIGIGTDADNQNINIGTAGDRTIAIGSSGGATGVTIDGGTAGFSLDGAGASNVGTSAGALTITGAGGINVGATTVLTDILGTLNVTEDADFDANLSFGGGQQVTDIVTTIGTPGSDVNLVTEQAVREAIDAEDLTAGEGTSVGADGTSINIGGGNAFTGSRTIDVDGSDLTIDATGGGSFIVDNNAGGNFQVTGSGGNVTVDNTGNLDAANGLDVTTSDLTVGGTNFIVDNSGNVTAEGDTDLNGDLTVDGSTFSLDAAGASNVTTSAGGLTLEGTDGVSITSTTSVGVVIDANTAGTIDIDGVDGVTLDASGGAIDIGTDADDQNINLGTAGDRTIAIGSSGGATGVTIDGGTAGFSLDGAGASNVGTSAGALTITGAGGINVGATTVLTDILGTLNVTEDADFDANLSFGGGQQVTDIVTTVGTPGSDVNLVTEQAVREAIDAEDLTAGEGTSVGADGTSINIGGGNAFTGSRTIDVDGSDLTIDATGGGSFIVDNNAGGNFQVTGSGGNVTVDNTGNLDAANGLDVTTSDLTVGGTNFIVDNSGNVTAEGDTDLNGDLTVDGSTFSLDAAGASNVTTSAGGLTLEGTDGVSITSTTSVGVVIDANTAGTIDIDGVDGVTLDASGGAIDIGTDADDQNINLGTAGDRTITLGSTGGTTGLILDAGSGGIDLTGATTINGGSLTIASGADATFNDNLTVADGTTTSINSSTIGIGNAAADAVTVSGTIQGATPLTFNAGNDNTTFAIDASSGSNRTITFPDADGTVVLDGDINLDAAYQGGSTITATDASGDLTVNLSQTSDFVIQDAGAPFITATNTGELDIDNLRIDGNTISSTNANGNILLVPNGTGVVQTSAIDIDGGNIASATVIDKDPVVNFNSGDVQGSLTLTDLGSGTGSLSIQANAVDETALNSSVAGAGLIGGGGSALAVGAGTGITVNANDIAVNVSGIGGDGITDFGSDGDLDLDINGLANTVATVQDADLLAVYDDDGALVGKMTRANFIESAAITNINIDGGNIASATVIDKDPVVNFNSGDVQGSLTLTDLGSGTGSLSIQANAVDETALNSSVAGAGLIGGGGSALAVGAGTGITVNANDIAVNVSGIGGDGITDFGSDGDLDLDINGLANTVATVQDADLLAVYDDDGALVGKMTRANFIESAAITNINISGGSITGITDLAVTDGGTGAGDASTARTNLGLEIGTNVQAYDAGLNSISGLTTAADQMVYTTASDTYAVTDLTAAGRAILDDANAAAQRTTLGLGSLSTLSSIGSSEVTDNSLTTDDLGPGSVNTSEIVDDAVTTDKLGTAGAGDANKTYTTDASGNPQLVTAVGFEAYLGSSQIVDGSVLVQFNTEAFDVNGDFDNSASNYSFTAPVDGLYHFEVQLEVGFVNATGETLSFSLFVNDGSPTEVVRATGIGTVSTNSFNTSKTLQLGAGDEVYVEFNTPGNRTISAGRARSFFSGHLIR